MRAGPGASAMLALLLAAAFAGCSDDNAATSVTLPSGEQVKVEEKVEEGKGFVHGLVGDDAIQLLDDVYIRLVGTEHNTRTGADGTFLLVNVEPGIYVLEGSKKDHATVQTTVDVHPGKVAKAVLLMERLPTTTPFCYTEAHQSHIDVGGGLFLALGNGSTRLTVDLDRDPTALVIESAWEGTIVGASEAQLHYRVNVLRNRDWYLEGNGPNPFNMAVEGRAIPPAEPQITVDVTPNNPGQTVFAADGVTYVTVFQNIGAPLGWSVVDGSDCGDFNAEHEDD